MPSGCGGPSGKKKPGLKKKNVEKGTVSGPKEGPSKNPCGAEYAAKNGKLKGQNGKKKTAGTGAKGSCVSRWEREMVSGRKKTDRDRDKRP